MGLEVCAVMPASRLLRTSSENAFAVMAMMGITAPSGLAPMRMARVASKPFILGIWMSMRMASNSPGLTLAKRSTIAAPSGQTSQLAPLISSNALRISALSWLSSAHKKRMPLSTEVSDVGVAVLP